jgi:glycerol-3-phosphate acyltransferase PlsX
VIATTSGALPVAVDAMGGDHAPEAIVRGALLAYEEGIAVTLVGDATTVRQHLPPDSGIAVVHAADAISMEAGAAAVRSTDDASIRVAMREVVAGRASSVVSCGSSGAALVSGVLDLGVMDGVDRPAIVTSLPRLDGGTLYLLDVGASADCKPHHLEGFAVLGSAWARTNGVSEPRVALLANGHEPTKGNRLVREAHGLLAAAPVHFVGNLEPDQALRGRADVLVCDGFSGNILLKTAEGVVGALRAMVEEGIEASVRAKLGAWLLAPALRRVGERLDWRRRGGALLLGTRAPVIIGHGRADAVATCAAIRLAHYASDVRVVEEVDAILRAAHGTSRGTG